MPIGALEDTRAQCSRGRKLRPIGLALVSGSCRYAVMPRRGHDAEDPEMPRRVSGLDGGSWSNGQFDSTLGTPPRRTYHLPYKSGN